MGRFSSLGSIILLVIAFPLCAQQSATVPASTSQPEIAPMRIPPPPENASAQELELKGDELRGEKAFLDSIDYNFPAIKKDVTPPFHNKAGISTSSCNVTAKPGRNTSAPS